MIKMRPFITILCLTTLFASLATAQVAAGGDNSAAATQADSQYPTVTTAASHIIVDGTTTVEYVAFTQTFATTALGSWALGATPLVGSIGLGNIEGTVGIVKTAS